MRQTLISYCVCFLLACSNKYGLHCDINVDQEIEHVIFA